MRGVGPAPTLTAAAAPALVLSPRMVGPWLRGSVAPWLRAQSARTLECRQCVSSEQRGAVRDGDGEL